MGLSFDSQAAATAAIDRQIAEAQARGQAKALAQRLVLYEHNPDPHEECNLPNPAHVIPHIRVIRPERCERRYVAPQQEECERHNNLVANLGREQL